MDCSAEVLFDIPPVIFERAATLRKLSLARNAIDRLGPAPLLAQLTSLRVLDLHSNRLCVLPDEIASLLHLKVLDVSCNELTALPDAIAQLSHLSTLRLSKNKVRHLPAVIGEMAALRKLDVRLNRLVALPREIGNLDGLRTLDLRLNRLTKLPATIRGLTSLTSLKLSGNDVVLPPEIGFMVSIKGTFYAYLRHCGVPSSFAHSVASRFLSVFTHKDLDIDVNTIVCPEAEMALVSLQMATGIVVRRDKPRGSAIVVERGGGGALVSGGQAARLRRMQSQAATKAFHSNFAFSQTTNAQSPQALRHQVWAARNASSRRRLAPRLSNKRGPAEALAAILLPRSRKATSSQLLTATRPRSCAALGVDPTTGRPSTHVLNDLPAWRYTKPPEFKLADYQTHQVVDTLEDAVQTT